MDLRLAKLDRLRLCSFLVLVFVLSSAPAAWAASSPTSLPTTLPGGDPICVLCHQTGPSHDSWTKGVHDKVPCTSCHTNTDGPGHPGPGAESINSKTLCHPGIGRQTREDLLARGDLSAIVSVARSHTPPSPAAKAAAAGHPKTACAGCHDLQTVSCSKCHKARHSGFGECTQCHRASRRWSFTHPSSKECTSCHAAPAKHYGGACADCHSPAVPFAKAPYPHTSASGDCTSCHKPPSGHAPGACQTCHPQTGRSWSFSHPGSTECNSCHTPTPKHFGKDCASCHSPAVPFAKTRYSHTSSAIACAKCHAAPAGHASGTACGSCHKQAGVAWTVVHPSSTDCASCHAHPTQHNHAVDCASCHKRSGVSWAFTHPASKACASCHRAPASHYGTSCASCHTPSARWSSATFAHPRIDGPHSWQSFQCTSCHPRGYTSTSCTGCHEGGD